MQSPRVWDVCCEGVEEEDELVTMTTCKGTKFKEISSRWTLLSLDGCWIGGWDGGGGGGLGGGLGVTPSPCFCLPSLVVVD